MKSHGGNLWQNIKGTLWNRTPWAHMCWDKRGADWRDMVRVREGEVGKRQWEMIEKRRPSEAKRGKVVKCSDSLITSGTCKHSLWQALLWVLYMCNFICSLQQLQLVGTINLPLIQRRQLKSWEVRQLAQSHPASWLYNEFLITILGMGLTTGL